MWGAEGPDLGWERAAGGLKGSVLEQLGQLGSRPGRAMWRLQGEGVAGISDSEILYFCSLDGILGVAVFSNPAYSSNLLFWNH